MQYPLIAPLVAFSIGVVAAQYATFSFRESSISILLLLLLALAGLWRGAARAGAAACLAGLAVAGALCASLRPAPNPENIVAVIERNALDLRDPVRLQGWIREPPKVRRDRDRFLLEVESIGDGIPARGGVSVTATRRADAAPLDLDYGERVDLPARLRHPRNFENPGGFDRVGYLLRQSVHLTASVRAGAVIARLEGRRGSRVMGLIWRIREWADRRVDALLGAQSVHGGVVKAMVLGDKAYLDRALGSSFQRTGTYHALVISGSHVAILAWFLLWLFRLLRVPTGWGAVLTVGLLAGFVLLAGSQLPTIRAACMVGAYLVGRLLYRQRRALNILAGTALGMLVADPADLFDVGFQLSFLSVALIAGVAAPVLERTVAPYRVARLDLLNRDRDLHLEPKIAQIRVAWRRWAERLPFSPRVTLAVVSRTVGWAAPAVELVVVSAAVQVGLALPMVIYFHRLSWTGLSANLVVVPLMSLMVPLGFLAIVTGWGALGQVLSGLVAAMVAVVEWHARLEWLEARLPAPAPWLVILCAASLAFLAWSIPRGGIWRWIGAAALAAGLGGLIVHPFSPRLERGRLEVTALDVGQGEALFLALPRGQTMLLDGGGLSSFGRPAPEFDIGEEVVSPYLWSRSIRALDVVVVSHAHYDHIGGLPALLGNFRVGELWVGTNPSTAEYERVLEKARQRGTRVVRLAAGDQRELGGVSFQALAPAADYTPRSRPSNDDSLVLVARFGERSFLLTGDVERAAERRLIAEDLVSHADVLKVPHHGSKTSANEFFLARATPWFALISAGYDNPYGHPHPDVLSRLAAGNARVLRTDREGLVTISTDGRRLSVSTYRWENQRRKPVWVE